MDFYWSLIAQQNISWKILNHIRIPSIYHHQTFVQLKKKNKFNNNDTKITQICIDQNKCLYTHELFAPMKWKK